MRGKLIDIQFNVFDKQRLVIEIDEDYRDKFDELKDHILDVDIKKHKEKRTLQANAYFHVLVGKIAEEKAKQGFNETNEAVKKQLVVDYGTLARDETGNVIGFKLPYAVDVDSIYPYTRCFDIREEGGKLFKCYLVYKQTHLMNTEEMCRLIDGTIQTAKELGIETETPQELAIRKALWEKENQSNVK